VAVAWETCLAVEKNNGSNPANLAGVPHTLHFQCQSLAQKIIFAPGSLLKALPHHCPKPGKVGDKKTMDENGNLLNMETDSFHAQTD